MEYLIRRGIPQRTAHGLVGQLVRKALDRGVRLADCRWTISKRPTRAGRERLRRAGRREGGRGHAELRLDRARAGRETD